MAVTKSRRITGWTLIVLLIISAIVCLVFFFGGTNTTEVEGIKAYNQTSLLLYWTYALLALTIIATLVFAFIGFARSFKHNRKAAIRGLVGFIALIVLLVITYAIGNGDPSSMNMLSEDSNKFLTHGWLKISDMVIYSCIVLLCANILALLYSAIRRAVIVKRQ